MKKYLEIPAGIILGVLMGLFYSLLIVVKLISFPLKMIFTN